MSLNQKKHIPVSVKAQAVRDAIQSVAPNRVRNWTRNLFTDEDAFEIIDGCLEGDYDPRTEWDQALNQFKRHFVFVSPIQHRS